MGLLFAPVLATGQHEGLHQLLEKRVGNGNQIWQRLGPNGVGVGDPGGQEAVRNCLGVHVRKLIARQVVDERLLEGVHQRPKWSLLGLESQQLFCSLPNPACKTSKLFRKLLGRPDGLAMAHLESRRPAGTPGRQFLRGFGPREV